MENQFTFKKLLVCRAGIIDYVEAWEIQKKLLQKKKQGMEQDFLLLLQHPHTYTLGKVAMRDNLLLPEDEISKRGIKVYDIDRGGDITYHGPGQIVGYPIIDLNNWIRDSHKYLRALEEIIIEFLLDYDVKSGRKEGLTGVWIDNRKIAAIGIKISSWITMHGFAFNINPDLSLFNGIIPCGIKDKEVTSLEKETDKKLDLDEISLKLADIFSKHFAFTHLESISFKELQSL